MYRQGGGTCKPPEICRKPEIWEKITNGKKQKRKIVNTAVNTIESLFFSTKQMIGREEPMSKNIKEIMIALDKVLTTTVWVNADRQIVSLSDELHIGKNNAPRSIEDLSRAALIGAYVSLQIRTDNFDVAAETLETPDLALRVKEMVFAEAKKIMDAEKTESKSANRMAA